MSAHSEPSPAPLPERTGARLADGAVAGWRWRNEGAPRLLFCHANGFCASAYRAMFASLAAFADIVAIDLRGHGRTTLPADPRALQNWDVFGRDIAAFLDCEGDGGPWHLAGHSLGAVSASLAARGRSDIAGLILIEPVALPPLTALFVSTAPGRALTRRGPLARRAGVRRAFWPSREAALALYAKKPVFAGWADGVLEDYLEDGLADAPGGVSLACDPAWEAAIFATHSRRFWPAVTGAPGPVSVLAADHRQSTLFAGAAARFRRAGARMELAAGASHLLPMERPAAAAEFIRTAIA